jgi:hypothetical protein
MPFHLPPRLSLVLVGALAVGIMLAVVGCTGKVTPLGPDPAANMPQPHHLRSPLILQDVRVQPPTPFGDCPAGYAAIPGSGQCYGDRVGRAVTIASAGVSPVSSFQPPTASGQQAPPVQYGFWITVPAADEPAAATVIPTASMTPGPPTATPVTSAAAIPAISVAGRTWVLVGFSTQPTDREFKVFLASQTQALQLQRALAASG